MRRETKRRFAAAACFLLSALLLVLMLTGQIRLCAVQSELRALEDERETLEREKRVLTVRLEQSVSLAEIERRASDELGMRPCRGDQIEEIGIDGEGGAYR